MKLKVWKKIVIGACMIGIIGGSGVFSSAYESYQRTFKQPFEGCAGVTGAQNSTDNPYVNPSKKTSSTTYVIIGTSSVLPIHSNYIKTGASGKHAFTYKSEYSGDMAHRMTYYPTDSKFLTYTVAGKWQP